MQNALLVHSFIKGKLHEFLIFLLKNLAVMFIPDLHDSTALNA